MPLHLWRLWTRGWGPRHWWFWVRTEGFPLWVARKLPPRIVYWAFIRVHALSGGAPGDGFNEAGRLWAATYRLDPEYHQPDQGGT